MGLKSTRHARLATQEIGQAQPTDFLMEGNKFLDLFAVGSWTPNIDIGKTGTGVMVRVELPGIDASEVVVTFQGENLRIQGIKREPGQSQKFLCYYCLERTYGKFDRSIHIGWVVNPKMARAYMEDGILTIMLPKIKDRRGDTVTIQIKKK